VTPASRKRGGDLVSIHLFYYLLYIQDSQLNLSLKR
jgi:hypothetical protein